MRPVIPPASAGKVRETSRLYKWGAVSIVMLLVLTSAFALLQKGNGGIRIDGNFSDWKEVTLYPDEKGDAPANAPDILSYALNVKGNMISFYLRTDSEVLSGTSGRPDMVQIFLDTDANAGTGYLINGIGADALVEITGIKGEILSSNLYQYDTHYRIDGTRGQDDWNGWAPLFNVEAAASGQELEAQLWDADIGLKDAGNLRVLFRVADYMGREDSSDLVVSPSGVLKLDVSSMINGNIHAGENELGRITITSFNEGTTSVNSLRFRDSGSLSGLSTERLAAEFLLTLNGNPIASTGYSNGRVDFALSSSDSPGLTIAGKAVLLLKMKAGSEFVRDYSGKTINLRLTGIETQAGLTISQTGIAGYINSQSNNIMIDGLFDDWTQKQTDRTGDSDNPNTDITGYNSLSSGNRTYFYLSVRGEILKGVNVPTVRAMNEPSLSATSSTEQKESGSPEIVVDDSPLPVEASSDTIYIFLETGESSLGYRLKDDFHADRMIEITGKDGLIHSAHLLEFRGKTQDDWAWAQLKTGSVKAAAEGSEMEASLHLTLKRVCFNIRDWSGENEDYSNPDMLTGRPEMDGTRYAANSSFEVPKGTGAPTIDGKKDSRYDSEGTNINGTYLHIWLFYYSSYIYIFVEVQDDSTKDNFDEIAVYFEKDHDDELEGDGSDGTSDEGTDQYRDSGGNITQTDALWKETGDPNNVWVQQEENTFDATINDNLINSKRTFELKLKASDCGYTSGTDETFGVIIKEYDSTGDKSYYWPDASVSGSGNRETDTGKPINNYGQAVPEFNSIVIPTGFMIAVVTIGISINRKKKEVIS